MSRKKSAFEQYLGLVKAGYWIMVIIILLFGLILAFGAPVEAGSNMSIFPMILIVFFLFRYLGMSKDLKDERLGKIASRAMTISWGFTLITTSALATMRGSYISDIDGGQILGIILFVLMSSMVISNEVYKRKGDIDW